MDLMVPGRPIPGMQNIGLHQPMRLGTCEEAGCEWFLNGKDGLDAGEPFSHPAGVRCGDFARCTDPNCPCPSRLVRSSRAPRLPISRLSYPDQVGHLVPDITRETAYHYAPATGVRLASGVVTVGALTNQARTIDEGEFRDRLQEGVGRFREIQQHGL